MMTGTKEIVKLANNTKHTCLLFKQTILIVASGMYKLKSESSRSESKSESSWVESESES